MPSISLSEAQNAIPTARATHGLSYSLRRSRAADNIIEGGRNVR